MNRDRRNQLEAALPLLAQAAALVAQARAAASTVRDEEQSAYDDLSDARRDGDAGDAMQASINAIDEALDAIDGLDLAAIQSSLLSAADSGKDADAPAAKLDAKTIERNRWRRLPAWAKKQITSLREKARLADERAQNVLSEATGKPHDLVVDDYGDPLHGRLLPSRAVCAPALGLVISVDRHGRGLQIRGERSVCVIPEAGNTVYVRPFER